MKGIFHSLENRQLLNVRTKMLRELTDGLHSFDVKIGQSNA